MQIPQIPPVPRVPRVSQVSQVPQFPRVPQVSQLSHAPQATKVPPPGPTSFPLPTAHRTTGAPCRVPGRLWHAFADKDKPAQW
eukprot:1583165-Pyramimonas_sp.AAC.1